MRVVRALILGFFFSTVDGGHMLDTKNLVLRLKAEGFRVTRAYIGWAIRDSHIPPPELKIGTAFVWEAGDIDRLRSFLIRQGRGPEGRR